MMFCTYSGKSIWIKSKRFFYGYSPERINPGDKKHKLRDILKIVSGSDVKTANILKKIYGSIIKEEFT